MEVADTVVRTANKCTKLGKITENLLLIRGLARLYTSPVQCDI